MDVISINELIQDFIELLKSRESVLECFTKYGVQVEGWLKGELLSFFDKKYEEGKIVCLDREVSYSGDNRKKIDLKITSDDNGVRNENWFELKHWLIGRQKEYKYNANFYFKDKHLGIKKDVEKLSQIEGGKKFLLILCTSNPGSEDWDSGLESFNIKFSFNLISLNRPIDFPNSFFLGLLKLD